VTGSPAELMTKSLRIMVVHNWYRSANPSGENRVVERESAALTARGHDVIRFDRHSDEIAQWPLPRKTALPARIIWSREAHQDLRAKLRSHRPDVVHVHNTFPLLSPAVLYACRDESVPVVITVHNYRLMCAAGSFFRDGAICQDCVTGPAIQAVRHGCYRDSRLATVPIFVSNRTHRQAWRSMVSAYIFISAAQRDLLSGLGLPPDRVFVRHNMIPRREVPPSVREDIVLFAGRLEEAKGVRVLMSAWDRYLARTPSPSLRLVIAGTGILQPEVAGWAANRPSVRLAGHVTADECTDLMARSRAVMLPSAWAEPFGLVAVEAMAAGAPCIAAAHGALPELVTNGVDGTLVPPGDADALAAAIGEVQTRPDLYAAYGEAARDSYQKRFDPEENLNQLVDIYRFAIAHGIGASLPDA
jgi:glycosyltransferase involved in cell wall biosynthesis